MNIQEAAKKERAQFTLNTITLEEKNKLLKISSQIGIPLNSLINIILTNYLQAQ